MPQHHSSVVLCRTCGHGYDGHADRGGPCLGTGSPAAPPGPACPCPGFRWIDPASPPAGPYTAPPLSPA